LRQHERPGVLLEPFLLLFLRLKIGNLDVVNRGAVIASTA
jgi:hypothetical protein